MGIPQELAYEDGMSDRLAYVRAYARLDEMVQLHSLGLGSTELLHAQREVIARELREELRRD